MEWGLFEKIVQDAENNGHSIGSLHFFGEPLMWPHIIDGVTLLSSNGFFPRISTNGMLLTTEMMEKLAKAGLKEILITIDTLKPEVYKTIREGGNFELVRRNIKNAIKIAPNVSIFAQLMPTIYNRNENDKDFYMEFGTHNNFKVHKKTAIRMNNSKNISAELYHKPNEVDKRLCGMPFNRVDILWDGTTVLCCLDYEGKLVTGNMKDNDITYSWIGPKIMELRKKILKGEWDQLSTCKQCMADHIRIDYSDWQLTKPLRRLPVNYRKILSDIEKLRFFDLERGKWVIGK
jgi:MoaA/NifB/PqqE/SkfB family radical SAM enzyme